MASHSLSKYQVLSTKYRSPTSVGDRNTHRSGGALDDLHCALDIDGIQIRHLGLGDLLDLSPGHLADLHLVRLTRALVDPSGLTEQCGGGRRLHDEVERSVLVDRD